MNAKDVLDCLYLGRQADPSPHSRVTTHRLKLWRFSSLEVTAWQYQNEALLPQWAQEFYFQVPGKKTLYHRNGHKAAGLGHWIVTGESQSHRPFMFSLTNEEFDSMFVPK